METSLPEADNWLAGDSRSFIKLSLTGEEPSCIDWSLPRGELTEPSLPVELAGKRPHIRRSSRSSGSPPVRQFGRLRGGRPPHQSLEIEFQYIPGHHSIPKPGRLGTIQDVSILAIAGNPDGSPNSLVDDLDLRPNLDVGIVSGGMGGDDLASWEDPALAPHCVGIVLGDGQRAVE
ncbi:uncharacterized protein N7515_009774 [Penicillium bovifimosum]|uniref:Uncharacterized protein n=1 Tax=Penicillium bovifimosum TaxID=126998 RepID=A0A9W9GHK5_9EURO|nr:uncharacterized protein N7515_009774 [Penicillium bovifimosum]KAJ5120386.1 hypothetical protein N7515_009774 [Penicillium bovifimosum]